MVGIKFLYFKNLYSINLKLLKLLTERVLKLFLIFERVLFGFCGNGVSYSKNACCDLVKIINEVKSKIWC